MPLHTESLQTRSRSQLLDLTSRIQSLVTESGIRSGLAVIYVPHTTAAVTINENADPGVQLDLLRKLDTLIPYHETYYQHAEGNSDSHLKTALTGNSATVIIDDGRLLLGTWQAIYFCEFDGPRNRNYIVKLIPD